MSTHNQVNHPVIDDDAALFTINPITRAIEYNSEDPLIIMADDTNSERLTFEIPKIVEGHDMTLCNAVQVHYVNIGVDETGEFYDIYPVTDLAVDPNNEDMLRFTWLVSRNATQLVGGVIFAVRFFCTDAEEDIEEFNEEFKGKILYEWSTAISKVIQIGESIRNTERLTEEVLSDVLAGWKEQLTVKDYEWVTDPNDPEADEKTFMKVTNLAGETFVSGNLKSVIPGPAPRISIGEVKTVDVDEPTPKVEVESYDDKNNPTLRFVLPEPDRDYVTDIKGNKMWFFSGTQAEYDALSDEQKASLFALLTDDQGNKVHMYKTLESSEPTITQLQFPILTYSAFESANDGGYKELVISGPENVVIINGIEIPFDGSFVVVKEMDGSSLDQGWQIKYLAGYNEDSSRVQLVTRAYYNPDKSYAGGTIPSRKIDGIVAYDACVIDTVNNEAFEYDFTNFSNWLAYTNRETYTVGDYIIDRNNNMYRLMNISAANKNVNLLLIRPNSAKDIYQHHILFESSSYTFDSYTVGYIKGCLTYISDRQINTFAELLQDVVDKHGAGTYIPINGIVAYTTPATDTHAHITFGMCNDSSMILTTVYGVNQLGITIPKNTEAFTTFTVKRTKF